MRSPTKASARGGFASTRWSVVMAAGQVGDSRSREALAQLFEVYWSPLYAFARRLGKSEDDARDLIQGFFTYLIERNGLHRAEQSKGRFRSYLLGAFKHFVSNQWQKDRALKRGGGVELLSLDLDDSERGYLGEPRDDLTPERVFERRWALVVLDRGLARLRKEYAALGKEELFAALKGFLVGSQEHGSAGQVGERLGMSAGAVRVAVHRLRRRFRELMWAEVANTVDSAEDVEAELRDLLDAFGR